jgi:hypothetical protein
MESVQMADNRQNKASAKKPFNKNSKPEAEIRTVDGHKTTIIRGEKVTILWKGMEVTADTHTRPRAGKTARDLASGAKRRNYENKQSRAQWQGDNRASISNFPWNSCNGKKNRTVFTGRDNERVTISYKAGGK